MELFLRTFGVPIAIFIAPILAGPLGALVAKILMLVIEITIKVVFGISDFVEQKSSRLWTLYAQRADKTPT